MSKNLRDTILFFSGLAGIGYMTVIGPVEPLLIPLFAGMIGLPALLRADEKSV